MAYTEKEQSHLDHCTRMYEEMLFVFNSQHIEAYIAEDYIQHSLEASGGREGLRAFLNDRGQDFPDCTMEIKHKFADGDFTIFHIHCVRHKGDPGMSVVDIFRMEDGKVKEHWECLQEIPENLPHGNGVF